MRGRFGLISQASTPTASSTKEKINMVNQEAIEELNSLKRTIADMSRRGERIDQLLRVSSAYSRATQLALQGQQERIADLERRILRGEQ